MEAHVYRSIDGLGLADLLRRRRAKPAEVMRCAIAEAERLNPSLNALCHVDVELGNELAERSGMSGHFAALPFLLKDSGLPWRRLPSSMGSRLFAGGVAPLDATLVERFLADGFLPFGRTTVPEFSMAPTTEAKQNGGPTRNPWNLERSSGGSSGGAAAAVASGIVPVAHGSDGGGSIRIPASCCGIYGLKPSRGLVPAGPARGEGWGGLATDGVLSRTVRDSAAALDGIAGVEQGAPYAAPAVPDSLLGTLDRPFARPLRIAKWTTGFEDIPISEDGISALARAEEALTAMGHEVVAATLPSIQFSKFVSAQIEVMAANVTLAVNGKVRGGSIKDWRERLEPAILDAYELGRTLSAEAYALAIMRFHTIGRQMATYMADYDFVLTPTLMQPPAPLGAISMDTDFRTFRIQVSRYATFLAIINASGQPAASLPLHWNADGLPIGVQLIGRFGAEGDLLRLSARLEEAAPWCDKRPPL